MRYFEARGLTVDYDRVTAIKDISIGFDEGQIVALIGANGAGKTTTLRAITALSRLKAGEIWFEGEQIDRHAPAALVERGIAMVPEGRRVFPHMSIRDNLLMGAYTRKDKAGVARDLERILARFPRLEERFRQSAGTLSGGEQEMLVVGRALMAKPRLLLLDEPSLGLAPMVVRDIANLIVEINRDEGVSVILVEQNSRMALRISQYAYVLETGRIGLEGASADLLHNDHVKALYLGG
ncbi:ABC transporter ATP-binding protein [Prosthecomicrobium pneumaticum]|uniref:Branched-chain amino acid transport system ATP-binding protein n=1 Tax=Prosthecomicrobium pneumaticum TaxID=81895 RepID=A0A7W9FJZ4_9HYPH|nr:ABC transporter ATP-binding protein [Prosthecomicrobium pneumaticum]MBB5752247.1 branched-chain amino acid transport system ATP-binding protein [Prosthecomicrobium pneumaticum]